MTEEILDHYVTDTDVERMADDLAIDEMHNLNFGDLQFVLKGLLRDKYKTNDPHDYSGYTGTDSTQLFRRSPRGRCLKCGR